jgi:hypothetical protein
MTSLIQFIVLRRNETWVVKSRELERVFGDESAAVRCAVELANESGKNGKPAVVLLRGRRKVFKPVWTYGKDSYPLTRSIPDEPPSRRRPQGAVNVTG